MCSVPVQKAVETVETNEAKKTYLSLYIEPAIKRQLEKRADREKRSLSNLCNRLLDWAGIWLERAGDSHALESWRAYPTRSRSQRISEETQEQLFIALATILERAPSTVIEEVTRLLTERAGKYGDKRK